MRRKKLLIAILLLLVVSYFGYGLVNGNLNSPSRYVGLREEDAIRRAESRGFTYRIARKDDQKNPTLTDDFNPKRVDFEIDDGIVTKAEIN